MHLVQTVESLWEQDWGFPDEEETPPMDCSSCPRTPRLLACSINTHTYVYAYYIRVRVCMCVCACPIGSASDMLLLFLLCLNADWYKGIYPRTWLYVLDPKTRLEAETFMERKPLNSFTGCHGSWGLAVATFLGWRPPQIITEPHPLTRGCRRGSPAIAVLSEEELTLAPSETGPWLFLLLHQGCIWEKKQTRLCFSLRLMRYIRCRWHLG